MSNVPPYLDDLDAQARMMPFDQFGRYHMLREAIEACRAPLGAASFTILDVGGFYEADGKPTLPSRGFLPHDDVTVLDVVPCDLPGYVQGDGAALRFDNASFDFVVSADTLEHIPRPRRAAFWRELLRVARHGVIVLAPFGTAEVETAEALLFAYIEAELHAEHQQLKEHRDYGLPRLDEWLTFLEGEGVPARGYPTGYLHAWLGMMLLKHMLMRLHVDAEGQRGLDYYYNRCFFPTERRMPAYRALVIAEKTPGVVEAVDAALAPTILPPAEDASPAWGSTVLPMVATAIQLYAPLEFYRHQVSLLERVIADQHNLAGAERAQAQAARDRADAERTRAEAERLQSEGAVRDLQERAAWLEQQTVVLQRQLDAVQNGRVMRLLNLLSRRK